MGIGSSLKKTWKRVRNEVRDIGRQASSNLADLEDSGGVSSAAAFFANPLIAQDIAGAAFGGALSRGADARTALSQAGQANASMASGGSEQQLYDLAAFNAALLAGAATGGTLAAGGGFTGGLSAANPLWQSMAATGLGAGVAGAAGAATYAGAQTLANSAGGSNSGNQGEAPPDLAAAYANDPNMSAQFNRLRKAARSLGRAGTFKNKGTNTSLGLGDSVLGDQLSLIGS